MFDERTVNAYKAVSAPPELKAKVLERAKGEKTAPLKNKKKTVRIIRQLSAAAACLVLMVGVWAMSRESGSGAELGIHAVVVEEAAAESLVRMAAEEPVTVKVEISCAADISCGTGELLVQGKDDVTPVNRGSAWQMDGEALVLWQVPAGDTAQTYEMTVSTEGETVTLQLSYDTVKNCWAVSFAGE